MELIDRLNKMVRSVSAALDLAASGDVKHAVLNMREAIQALREDILSAKGEALALKERNLELEQRLNDVQRFETERERYTSRTLETGSVVYVPIEAPDTGDQPGPYLCAHCFERGQRSYLQPPAKRGYYRDTFACSICGYQAAIPNDLRPPRSSIKQRSDWNPLR